MPCKNKVKQRIHQQKHYKSHRDYYKTKREIRRQGIINLYNEYKSNRKCFICPENDPITLDFHHLIESEKESLVHRMVYNGRSWTQVMKEIEKCVLLCANCHRKVHSHNEWAAKLDHLKRN